MCSRESSLNPKKLPQTYGLFNFQLCQFTRLGMKFSSFIQLLGQDALRRCDRPAGLARVGRGRRLCGFAIPRTPGTSSVCRFRMFHITRRQMWSMFLSWNRSSVLNSRHASNSAFVHGVQLTTPQESPKAVWAFTSLDAFRRPLRLYPEGLSHMATWHEDSLLRQLCNWFLQCLRACHFDEVAKHERERWLITLGSPTRLIRAHGLELVHQWYA